MYGQSAPEVMVPCLVACKSLLLRVVQVVGACLRAEALAGPDRKEYYQHKGTVGFSGTHRMSLKRNLGLIHVFCIASGAMISSGLFVLPGIAFAKTGPAVIVCYLLAGLLSLPGMLSLAEMTTAMPKAGADCYTVIRSMGPGVGTVSGLLSWFSLSMKSAFALMGMAVFAAAFASLEIHMVGTLCCLVFVTLNILGIEEAGRTQVLLVLGLLGLMVVYVALGLQAVKIQHFEPFTPHGSGALFMVVGYVFISYAGLLKVASVAEEIRNPGRNIPLGMLLALAIVSAFYSLMVFVTVGVLPAPALAGSLTPISDAASVFMGAPGRVAMSIAAILAFLTTANAGIMTAARSLVPLSREGLFPGLFGRINTRFGTPHTALLLTGAFIIASLFLDLELLVESASIVLIMTNALACISIIILRESGLQNYRPRFRAPLYPWFQVAGLLGFAFILLEMGEEAYLISLVLGLAGFCAYWLYGRRRVRRESALMYLVERITARELVDGTLESELREVIRERDNIISDRVDELFETCAILDLKGEIPLDAFFGRAADTLADRLGIGASEFHRLLVAREKQSSTVVAPGLAIPHIVVEGKVPFDMLIARCVPGIRFAEGVPLVHAVVLLVGGRVHRNFHLRCLAAVAQIVQSPDFDRQWLSARGGEALRDIFLLGERRRE
jgi:amino acid transporter